jgi:hypothetical protein
MCNIKVALGGNGYGKGDAGGWATLMKAYGFKDEAEALAYRGNPVDALAPLAKAKVAIIHVIGDADDVVQPAKNSALIEQRYQQLGGEIPIIHKPGVGHHPHGLDDPEAGCRFHLEARVASVTRQGYSFAQPSTMRHLTVPLEIAADAFAKMERHEARFRPFDERGQCNAAP